MGKDRLMLPIVFGCRTLGVRLIEQMPSALDNPNPAFFEDLGMIFSEDKLRFKRLVKKNRIALLHEEIDEIEDIQETPPGNYVIWMHNGLFYREVTRKYAVDSFDENVRPLTLRELIYGYCYYGDSYLDVYAAGSRWKKIFTPFLSRRGDIVIVGFEQGAVDNSNYGTACCLIP